MRTPEFCSLPVTKLMLLPHLTATNIFADSLPMMNGNNQARRTRLYPRTTARKYGWIAVVATCRKSKVSMIVRQRMG